MMRFLKYTVLFSTIILSHNSWATKCPEIDLGGIFNSENSAQRIQTTRLTFATQKGELASLKTKTWNTYVPTDLNRALLIFNRTEGSGNLEVTVCAHDHEKDPGVKVSELTISANGETQHELNNVDNKFISVFLHNKGLQRSQYRIRLKRPTQGELWREARNSIGPQRGFADLHNHQVSEWAFGGYYNQSYIHGKHEESEQIRCDGTHSTFGQTGKNVGSAAISGAGAVILGPLGLALSQIGTAYLQLNDNLTPATPQHLNFPSANSRESEAWWPHYADGSHSQTTLKQLRNAHQNGMRLLLATAVSNQALCILTTKVNKRRAQCDDMDSAKAQLKAMIDFDEANNWYKIVRDPWEARQVIESGNLAVVLGVEVSNLMPDSHGNWREQLDELYDMGVRSIELAHETDSRFSGNAHQHGIMFKIMNVLKRMSKEIRENIIPAVGLLIEGEPVESAARAAQALDIFHKTRGPQYCAGRFQDTGIECNKLGLSAEGRELIDLMIEKKMFLPLDHISRRSREDVYNIVKQRGYYPVFASHTRPDAIMHPQEQRGNHGSHEYMLTDDDFTKIRRTGGVVGLRTGDNTMLEIPGCIDKEQISCWGSTESVAQMLCHGARTGMAMAYGTDFAGPVVMTAPRFSHRDPSTHRYDRLPAACPRNVEKGYVTPFGYKEEFRSFEPQSRGGDIQDFAVRGLSHTGQLSPMIADMEDLGAPIDETRFEYSADSVIRMWMRMYEPRREMLTDAAYRQLMSTEVVNYPAALEDSNHDHHLRKAFIKCMKKKANGEKGCDSEADWNALLIKERKQRLRCPAGFTHEAYVHENLFCQKILPQPIKRADCERTIEDGLTGSLNVLEGYCAWSKMHTANEFFHVRRLKENTCPIGMKQISSDVTTGKGFCRMDVSLAVAEDKCSQWGGQANFGLQGYCVRDEGDYFQVRKLVGRDKDGNLKCPGTLKSMQFSLNDETLYCREAVAVAISEENCRAEKDGRMDVLEGYCARAEDFYTQIWKLKLHNKQGERICEVPYTKLKVQGSPETLFCKGNFPISLQNCTADGGTTDRIQGYCTFNKGDWFLARRLEGFTISGEKKCPNLLNRVDIEPTSDDLFCKSAVAITEDKCDAEGGVTTRVDGYCTRQESDYVRAWQLVGFDSDGNYKYKCPVGLYKVGVQDDRLFCKSAVSSKISIADCRAEQGNSSLLSGYCAWAREHYQWVRPLNDYGSTVEPVCPDGTSYEIRDPLNKDRCKRVTTTSVRLQCNLLPTDIAANWTGPHSQFGEDECRSTKGKAPKGVKCPLGYKKNTNNGADTCTKSEESFTTPTCAAGLNYLSQKGKDACVP